MCAHKPIAPPMDFEAAARRIQGKDVAIVVGPTLEVHAFLEEVSRDHAIDCPTGLANVYELVRWLVEVGGSRVVVEYPDALLHPRQHEAAVSLFRSTAGRGRKVIFTARCPYFLDHFKELLDEVFIVISDFQVLCLADADPRVIHPSEDLPLGELWYSGLLGGTEDGRGLWNYMESILEAWKE